MDAKAEIINLKHLSSQKARLCVNGDLKLLQFYLHSARFYLYCGEPRMGRMKLKRRKTT